MKNELTSIPPVWTLHHLYAHFQGAMDLEMWTIPYYLTVMYSIKDPSSTAYRLIQSAVYQEMLHAQLVANIANAYGYSPTLTAPRYEGQAVPHLQFDLDTPNPTVEFSPYSAELGPLDRTRINTMCLIEYPEWRTERTPEPSETLSEYGSIGEFYVALRVGMTQLRSAVRGNVKQMEQFGPFYNQAGQLFVSEDGDAGFRQAMTLVDIVTDQGEGQTEQVGTLPAEYQNTADSFENSWPHFQKFDFIRRMADWPNCFSGMSDLAPGTPGYAAQQQLIADFRAFLGTLGRMFNGEPRLPTFGAQMAKLGGDVLTCWQRNAIPRFS